MATQKQIDAHHRYVNMLEDRMMQATNPATKAKLKNVINKLDPKGVVSKKGAVARKQSKKGKK